MVQPRPLQHPQKRIPLWLILVLPFMVQTAGAVALLGYLCYRSEQETVTNLATRLLDKTSDRIVQSLENYFEVPRQVVQENQAEAQLGILDWRNLPLIEAHFIQQLRIHNTLSELIISTENKEFLAVSRATSEQLSIRRRSLKTGNLENYYANLQGKRPELKEVIPDYDPHAGPRSDSWYEATKQRPEGHWRPIISRLRGPEQPRLMMAYFLPLVDTNGRVQGVLSASAQIERIGAFLQQLKIGSGQAFLLDEQGFLMATSTSEIPLRQDLAVAQSQSLEPNLLRLRAAASQNPVTQALATWLQQNPQHRQTEVQRVQLHQKGKPYFVRILPFHVDDQIHWTIAVVVPESDFIAANQSYGRTTLAIGLGMLGLSIGLGLWTAKQVTQRLNQISRASQAIAAGDLPQQLSTQTSMGELADLAQSFNQMVAQVHQSFEQMQTALAESEAKFATVFRTSPDPLAILAFAEGQILAANDNLVDFLGYRRADLIGKTPVELELWVDLEERKQFRQQLQTAGVVQNREMALRLSSGQVKTVLLSAETCSLDGQNCVIVAIKDISDRKHLERALQASQAKLAAVLDTAVAGIIRLRLYPDLSFQYDYVSPHYRTLFGCTDQEWEISFDVWRSLIHPDDWHNVVFPTIQSLLNQRSSTTYSTEYRIQRQNGSLHWVLEKTWAQWQETEECWALTIVQTDISDLKAAEIALQHSEAHFRKISDVSPANIYILVMRPDGSFYFEHISQAIEAIHELKVEDILADASVLLNRIHPEDRPGYVAAVQQSLTTWQPFRHEWRIINPSGTVKWLQGHSQPQPRDNGEVAWYGVVIDISDRKRTETALLQANQEMAAIFAAFPDLIFYITADGYIHRFQAKDSRNLSTSSEQFLTQTLPAVLPLEVGQDLHEAVQRSLAANTLVTVEYTLSMPEGEAFFDARIAPMDETSVIAVVRDITVRKQAEAALSASEQKFRSIFNSTVLLIGLLSPEGRILDVNETALQIADVTIDEVVGQFLWQGYWFAGLLDSQQRLQAHFQMALTGTTPRFEVMARAVAGTCFWVEVTFKPLFDAAGQLDAVLAEGWNITDRKQSELALQRINQQLRAFLENAPVVISLFNAEGCYLQVNPAFAALMGQPEAKIVGRTFADLFPPSVVQTFQTRIAWLIEHGVPLEIEDELLIDGTRRVFQTTLFPVPEESGQATTFWAIATDITDRKQAEAALQHLNEELEQRVQQRTQELVRSEQDLRTIFNNVYDAIFIHDLDGSILAVNDRALTLHGATREQILSGGLAAISGPNAPINQISELMQQVQREGMVQREWCSRRLDTGEILDVEVSLCAVTLGNRPVILAGVRDIRDRKRAEAALHQLNLELEQRIRDRTCDLQKALEAAEVANQAKSLFLASMSHELRTPLNVILGFAQLLRTDLSLSAEQQEYIHIMQRSGDHLLRLINDILNLSKIEAGQSILESVSIDFLEFLTDLEVMFREIAHNRGLIFYLDLSTDLPLYIKTDSNKLRQILINLINNAIKFTDRGSVTLHVSHHLSTAAATTTDAPSDLCFEVEDTGVGIAPEEQAVIFEAFTQARAGRLSLEGTGLGLTISSRLVHLLGGELTVHSTLGQGSTFRFTIPLHLANADEVPTKGRKEAVVGLASGQPAYRILVVDDQPDNRYLLVKLLTQIGLQVQEAVNGREAIAKWHQWHPHLIWMDMYMPDIDGCEATRQIRTEEKQREKSIYPVTKIIALTAQTLSDERSRAFAAGCDDFVSKPLQIEEILTKMAEHLGLSYLYQDESPPVATLAGQKVAATSLDAIGPDAVAALQEMPFEWVAALRQAALHCDEAATASLIQQIPAAQGTLANSLGTLLHNYRFEVIVQLTNQPIQPDTTPNSQ